MPSPQRRPVVLCILDGWGFREETVDNAIALANTPVWDALWQDCPHAFLQASELNVGLPVGQMGNSEVGHMNIGAGRVVMQDLPMIDTAVARGELASNAAVVELIAKLRQSGGRCHLLGLLSPGGVHSHQDHIVALARIITGAGIPVVVHAFLDGRDVPPQSARDQVTKFVADTADLTGFSIGTVSGRFYAMDRDKRWDRVATAYRALVQADGVAVSDPVSGITQSYAANVNDEFVLPQIVAGYAGMTDGDGVLMANFRSDRARELLTALLDPDFTGFTPERRVKFAAAFGMVEYSTDLNRFLTPLFPPKQLTHVLGEVIADAGLKQLRIAETEKYPHVTFFFNGGEERQYAGEDRILVPSPKVATYDLQPEMSAAEVTDRLVEAIDSAKYDLVVVNFANPDMVGHTGILSAAIKAIETVDHALGRLVASVRRQGGAMFVTADHGNAELMRDPVTGEPHTAHTLDVVPAILVDGPAGEALRDGVLADIAPTLLRLIGLPQPAEMTGHSLIGAAAATRHAAE
ncbi:MAG: 2,3-bisphosphoglycerate-independent phosphoglycerate mutase [Azospirillaceae bacterium]|nr:2,3-bisphosphoglycerate-independent phosphoglycerate mutase [Azospirillaceae bacterium]